jgi:preprotein translocase subunit YajC
MLNAMTLSSVAPLLLAQAAPQNSPGQQFGMMIPIILVMIAFWALTSGSQRKRAKKHEELLKTLRAGDKVTTTSGIVGVVVTVKERSINLRSADSKLEVLKTAISDVLERDNRENDGAAAQS